MSSDQAAGTVERGVPHLRGVFRVAALLPQVPSAEAPGLVHSHARMSAYLQFRSR
jgi:hypothetical protein